MPDSPAHVSGKLDASGLRFAIIVSRYNSLVTKELLEGALDAIERHAGSRKDQLVVWSPGGFEIPLLVREVLETGRFDGVVALGCVMRGETPHNEYIAAEASKALASLSLQYGKPVGFGVLTPDTLEQALERSGLKMGNKGAEAALAVIEAVRVQRAIAKLK